MRPSLVFCGEALIDFITTDGVNYTAYPGGSPYSAAKAAARAGGIAAFCGAVSNDIFGAQIMSDLEAFGVDTTFVLKSDNPTVLGFVKVLEDEHPQYAFFDRESAVVNMVPTLPSGVLKDGVVLCVGSISLIANPGADNIAEFALKTRNGALLALDPNVRPSMIANHIGWRPRMDVLIGEADIIKISTEDLAYYAPGKSSDKFAQARLSAGTSLVVITDGERGAYCWTQSSQAIISTVPAVGGDTVGAGDTMFGFLLARLAELGATTRDGIRQLSKAQLVDILKLSTTAAGINCQRVGCQPPFRQEVEKALLHI